MTEYFGGEPWQRAALYRERSPVFHAAKATTPTLIQHGARDVRVPVGQGYELYNVLKRAGGTVTMVVYPRMGHTLTEPRMALDMMRRNLDWFARWVRP